MNLRGGGGAEVFFEGKFVVYFARRLRMRGGILDGLVGCEGGFEGWWQYEGMYDF